MDWGNELNRIFDRYTGAGGGAAAAPQDPHGDFQQVARSAPQEDVAGGISQAMRSDQTPPFGKMAADLFGQSNPQQQSGLLNRLISAVGPGASSLPGLGSLAGLLGGHVTPEQAAQVRPEEVQQLAAHAEQKNPSVVDEVSRFYSQHPDVVKALGGMALAIAIQHIARRR